MQPPRYRQGMLGTLEGSNKMSSPPGPPAGAGQPPNQPYRQPYQQSAQAGYPAGAYGQPSQSPVPPKPATPASAYIKPTIFAIVLAYVLLFVFFNRDAVPVSFVFGTANISLIFVLAGTFIIGAIMGAVFVLWWRRRSAKKKAAKAAAAAGPGAGR